MVEDDLFVTSKEELELYHRMISLGILAKETDQIFNFDKAVKNKKPVILAWKVVKNA